ncbi:MAG: BamA/TamA family outer membrane protein [Ignavibacteriaceae bacterium]|nr:BamA/TamA family outer membrane protein [Ignavibacteriaceae bacterium]
MAKLFTGLFFLIIFTLTLQAQNRYELSEIQFNGNKAISTSLLREAILSEETPWWFWKFINKYTSFGAEPVYFDSLNIPIDKSAILSFYKTHGFFVTELNSEYSVDTLNNEVILIYNIIEGDAANFYSYKLHGLDSLDQYVLLSIDKNLAIDTTERYNQDYLKENIQLSLNTMRNNGYVNAKFDSTIITQDTISNFAKLDIYYASGRKYFIDTVIVEKSGEGESFVSDELLQRITGLKTGELYNLEKIKRSQSRLFRTGLFNSLFITEIDSLAEGSKIPLKLMGSIGLMNEVSPELIVNNQQNAFNIGLGTSYIRKNFLGDARKLTLSGSFGLQDIFKADFSNLINRFSFRDTTLLGYLDGRVTLDQPYLFNKPIFGTWESYVTINKQVEINNTLYGSKITFEFELPKYTFVNFLSTFYNIEQSNEVYRNNNDSLSIKLLSIIGADLGKTTADDPFFPAQGYNISLNIEEANSIPYFISKMAGGNFTDALFYKLLFNSGFYFALDNKKQTILAAKFKVGHLQVYKGTYAGIPYNRTFFAGGGNSVRGWRSNELIPRESVSQPGNKGGTFLLEGSLEWRLRFLKNLGTVLFGDYGNTWLGYKKFRYDELALTLGIGFRYYSPVAPFRLDFGTKFYDPFYKKYIWNLGSFWKNIDFQFGIGESF